MNKYTLSQSTIEKLGYYVYLLIDPRDNKVFYVGKGKGNRINQHLLGALDNKTEESDKINRIRVIQNSGLRVRHKVMRHGLTEEGAYEVECALIDFIGIKNLTNIVKGHNSEDRGLMDLEDIKVKYEAEDIMPEHTLLLININNLYHRSMTCQELYEATRQHWKVNLQRVKDIKYACSVYRGIIREVFEIQRWLPSKIEKGRSIFEGKQASPSIRDKYMNKSVSKYWKKGSRYPIKYIDA